MTTSSSFVGASILSGKQKTRVIIGSWNYQMLWAFYAENNLLPWLG